MPRHPKTATPESPREEASVPAPVIASPDTESELPPPPEPASAVTEISTEPFPPSIVEDVLKMKRDWVSRRQAAIDELLKRQKAIVVQLAELEYKPEPEAAPAWVSSPAPAKRKYVRKTVAKKTKTADTKFCPICNIETNHDGRKHKGQKKKRPFTAEEIAAL